MELAQTDPWESLLPTVYFVGKVYHISREGTRGGPKLTGEMARSWSQSQSFWQIRPGWYTFWESCAILKQPLQRSSQKKRANAADSVPELRIKAALGLIGDALAVTGRKARTKRKQDVKGERISHLPRRSRAGAEGPSVCFPCAGTVFRHASRDTKSIKVHLYYSKRSYYG